MPPSEHRRRTLFWPQCDAAEEDRQGEQLVRIAFPHLSRSTARTPLARSRTNNHAPLGSGAGQTFFIGRPVQKEFKGFGMFIGRVADFHTETGYRIEYDDGDSEDVTEEQLVRPPRLFIYLLHSTAGCRPHIVRVPRTQVKLIGGPSQPIGDGDIPSNLSKRTMPPAVRLREYVSAARAGARRKRKHTELKRSGVLERR